MSLSNFSEIVNLAGWLPYLVSMTITGPHAVSRMLPIA
jgi:hypothetical protein